MADRIKVLLLGSGGREAAIAASLRESRIVSELHCAPGSDGIECAARHSIDMNDGAAVAALCTELGIGLAVCGPEAPLVAGVGDEVRKAGIPFFGPGRDGAMLEGSKIFAKNFMKRHGIPTANFDVCVSPEACRDAIACRKPPYVIKADGLASGKGVFLPEDEAEALSICRDLLDRRLLSGAGARIVIEDFTPGLELTVFAVTDGERAMLLPPSRDHKRAFDGDRGPNTGGMGAFAPVDVPDGFIDEVERTVLQPTLAGLRAEGIDYRGVLYMGLMIKLDGHPSVVEYNVRFGDPETQVVLPLLECDLGELMLGAAKGDLPDLPRGASRHALGVVLASGGYPGSFERGFPIEGLGSDSPDSRVFISGARRADDGSLVTDGGRVLTAVGLGASFEEAREAAYARASSISFKGMHCRKDIGKR